MIHVCYNYESLFATESDMILSNFLFTVIMVIYWTIPQAIICFIYIWMCCFIFFIHNKCPAKPWVPSFRLTPSFPTPYFFIVFPVGIYHSTLMKQKKKIHKIQNQWNPMFFGKDSLEIEYKWFVSPATPFLQMSPIECY